MIRSDKSCEQAISAYHRVRNIRMRCPDVPLGEERTQVRPPGVTCPSKHLLQEPPVGLHRTEELSLLAALDVGAPAVGDHPAGEELVIARVELVLPKPVVVREAVQELGILQDDRAVGSSTAGETRQTTVDVGRRGDLDVPDRETESGENLPDRHAVADGLYTMRSSDTTDLLVLETRQCVWEEGRRPDSVIVGEDDDVGRGVFDAVGHLEAFVGEGDGQDADALGVDLVGEVLQRAKHFLFRDDENLLGLADKPAVGGLLELLSGINGGDDDRDIFFSNVGGVLW